MDLAVVNQCVGLSTGNASGITCISNLRRTRVTQGTGSGTTTGQLIDGGREISRGNEQRYSVRDINALSGEIAWSGEDIVCRSLSTQRIHETGSV